MDSSHIVLNHHIPRGLFSYKFPVILSLIIVDVKD